MIKEKPILFSGSMVRAILEDRKTQTRRVIKPQPDEDGLAKLKGEWRWQDTSGKDYICPYGNIGDRLWVRETFRFDTNEKEETITFRADGTVHHVQDNAGLLEEKDFGKWKPSIFMPRWASRITLEITDIQVQRIQDISEEDAIAEGIEMEVVDQTVRLKDYSNKVADEKFDGQWFQSWSSDYDNYIDDDIICRESFHTLWDSINAKRGYAWESNPWVYAISFKRITS